MFRNPKAQDRLAMLVFALLLAVCTVTVVGFIVLAALGPAPALAAAAAMTIVVAVIVLGLNRAVGL